MVPCLTIVINGESTGQGMNSPKNINLDLLIDGFHLKSVGLRAFAIFVPLENEGVLVNQ